MKKYLFLLLLLFTGIGAFAQTDNPDYDAELAKKLEADEYGMKQYVFVILKTGPAQIDDKEKLSKLFKGHMENINKLAATGKLTVAGPFIKNDNGYRGIFIFDVKTIEEAKALLEGDPTVTEGVLEAEMFLWYGSAALSQYMEVHNKIEKIKH